MRACVYACVFSLSVFSVGVFGPDALLYQRCDLDKKTIK